MSDRERPAASTASSCGISELSPKVRLRRLLIALAGLLFILYVLAPLPIKYFGPMRDYARKVEETGINPGALYYTDVPQSVDAEVNNRDAIRYFSGKKKGEKR